MRPIWRGALTFGLVNIPVGLYSATTRSDLSFRLLHAKDQAPIAYRRVCTEENVEVPWGEIVKGYEYEKGHFVVMTEEDFAQADVEATQTIDIRDFVRGEAIPATYFEQPYYLEPQKTGAKGYALLREALKRSGRVGVATVVLRQREHLAAVQPAGDVLTLTTIRSHDQYNTTIYGLNDRYRGITGRRDVVFVNAADLAQLDKDTPIVVLTHRPLFDLYRDWDWFTADGDKALALLQPFANVTVFYGHIHQEHHFATGHIQHHAAQSLMLPLPAPGSKPKRIPFAWDPSAPYRGMGWREIDARGAAPAYLLAERPVVGA